MSAASRAEIDAVYRGVSGRVLATLVRLLGDLDRAEEAMHEAFGAALVAWPRDGLPRNPAAWLVSTGRFKGIDALRRAGRGRALAAEAAAEPLDVKPRPEDADDRDAGWRDGDDRDDQLRLVFTCCHPAIPLDGRVALALRVVCGLTVDQIARAYLANAEATKKRITRAKALIRERRLPYAIPGRDELPERLDAVLQVIYLVYNEAFAATTGEAHTRPDLAAVALGLARHVAGLLPEPEALGLLALLLLHESRAAARVSASGDIVDLEHQDRALWDRALVDEGLDRLEAALMSGRAGRYTLQAAIASVHASAPSVADTPWRVIVHYYDALLAIQPSPVVGLQRAIALGMADGPDAGLALILPMVADGGALAAYHPAHAAHAELARRAGRVDEARQAYERALAGANQAAERRYLARRLGELG